MKKKHAIVWTAGRLFADQGFEVTTTLFEKIENLIDMHLGFVKALSHETKLIVSACPAKLRDPEHICTSNFARFRERIRSYLTECLSAGIASGEFRKVSVSDTADVLAALINGLVRQQSFSRGNVNGVREAAVSFCRFSLVNP